MSLTQGILAYWAKDNPYANEIIRLVNRMWKIAPAYARWTHLPEPKGPPPDVHPDHREELEQIISRGRAIRAIRRAEKAVAKALETKEGPLQPPKPRL